MESRPARVLIKGGSLLTLAFLYVPLAIVAIYAFNDSIGQSWPIQEYTTKWFGIAFREAAVREALVTSLQVALFATVLALILGSAAAFAVHRFDFFGRNTVSFVLVLPIALPGIVTAIALRSAIETFGETFDLSFGVLTIMIGHATFCIVVVYNNVLARLRRTPTSLIEASMDLGADGWQTFRHVTFPAIRTAVLAGGLLSFALSFDEIIVTNFLAGSTLTLPKFIYNSVRLPRNRPVVNVVAVVVVLLMLIPVYIAQRLAGGPDVQAAAKAQAAQGGEI
jgi:putative spermidine/putrescine transport system permease protein